MSDDKEMIIIKKVDHEDFSGIALISLDKERIEKLLKDREILQMATSKSSGDLASLQFHGNPVWFACDMDTEDFLTEVERKTIEAGDPVLLPEGRDLPVYDSFDTDADSTEIGSNCVNFVSHNEYLNGELFVDLTWEFLIKLLGAR